MSQVGDRFRGMNGGPVECEVVFTGRMYLFNPETSPSIPSSLLEGESSCPAKATSPGTRSRQGSQTSAMATVPSGAPGGWS